MAANVKMFSYRQEHKLEKAQVLSAKPTKKKKADLNAAAM